MFYEELQRNIIYYAETRHLDTLWLTSSAVGHKIRVLIFFRQVLVV